MLILPITSLMISDLSNQIRFLEHHYGTCLVSAVKFKYGNKRDFCCNNIASNPLFGYS